MFSLISNSSGPDISGHTILSLAPYLGFILPIFSALRLAKFNIDEEQTTFFKGIPTPAAAILVGSLPLVLKYSEVQWSVSLLNNCWFLIILTCFISLMMVSNIPMISLKFKNLDFKENAPRYVLIVIALILGILLKFDAIPLIMMIYILISILFRRLIEV